MAAKNVELMQTAGEPIVVEASADGFEAVQVSIPTSVDPADSVFAAAEAAAGKPVNFFASG